MSASWHILRHWTTRQRAEAILAFGPDPSFVEPGGSDPARGFSVCPANGPFPCGTPDQYAAGKARLFPTEGVAAVVEIEVPADLVALAIDAGGEFRFEPGYGLAELRQAWPVLTKRIL